MIAVLHRCQSIAEEQTRYIMRQAFLERTDNKNGLSKFKLIAKNQKSLEN